MPTREGTPLYVGWLRRRCLAAPVLPRRDWLVGLAPIAVVSLLAALSG
jgi:hypothetical protein